MKTLIISLLLVATAIGQTPTGPAAKDGSNITTPGQWKTNLSFLEAADVSGAYEPILNNPGTNGHVLSSTTGGARSWVAMSGGSNLTSGPVTSSGSVSAIANGAITLPMLSQTSADVGETIKWDGSKFDPAPVQIGATYANTCARIIAARQGVITPVFGLAVTGDSWALSPGPNLRAVVGTGGMLYIAQGVTTTGSSPTNYSFDYACWDKTPIGGTSIILKAGGAATFQSSGGINLPPWQYFTFMYEAINGGGTFKIQYLNTSGAYVDFPTTATYSTDNTGASTFTLLEREILNSMVGVSSFIGSTKIKVLHESGGDVRLYALAGHHYTGNNQPLPGTANKPGFMEMNFSQGGSTSVSRVTTSQQALNVLHSFTKTSLVVFRDSPSEDLTTWKANIETEAAKIITARKSGITASGNIGTTASTLSFTAATIGEPGEAVTVTIVNPGTPSASISSSVVGSAITLSLATNGSSVATTTYAQAAAHLNANGAVTALASFSAIGNTAAVQDVTSIPRRALTGVGVDILMVGSHPTGNIAGTKLNDKAMGDICDSRGWGYLDALPHFPRTLEESIIRGMTRPGDSVHMTNEGSLYLQDLIANHMDPVFKTWNSLDGQFNLSPKTAGDAFRKKVEAVADSSSEVGELAISRHNSNTNQNVQLYGVRSRIYKQTSPTDSLYFPEINETYGVETTRKIGNGRHFFCGLAPGYEVLARNIGGTVESYANTDGTFPLALSMGASNAIGGYIIMTSGANTSTTQGTENMRIDKTGLRFQSIGHGIYMKRGSNNNNHAGTVTLSSGAGTITSSAIDADSVIFASLKTSSGTPGLSAPRVDVAAGSATVTGAATDNSTYNWVLIRTQ